MLSSTPRKQSLIISRTELVRFVSAGVPSTKRNFIRRLDGAIIRAVRRMDARIYPATVTDTPSLIFFPESHLSSKGAHTSRDRKSRTHSNRFGSIAIIIITSRAKVTMARSLGRLRISEKFNSRSKKSMIEFSR